MKNFNKNLIVSFFSIALAGVILLALINYAIDPLSFFRLYGGYTSTIDANGNQRVQRGSVLKNSPNDTYEGIILGGSKSAAITSELMHNYTGLNYLGCSVTYGDFIFYEQLIRFALQHQQLKHIVLHISGIEIYTNPPESESCRIPDFIDPNGNVINDYIYYLFADFNYSLDFIIQGKAIDLKKRFTVIKRDDDYFSPLNPNNDAIRDYLGINNFSENDDFDAAEAMISGLKTRSGFINYRQNVEGNSIAEEDWANRNVTNLSSQKAFERDMHRLFYEKKWLINAEKNIEHLKNIISLCDEYGVELTVILGSTFLSERIYYEGQEYWEYLYQIAQLTDFYDFSYFCDINMNPYNFYDTYHNFDFVAYVMVDNIYGEGEIPYGKYVTKENFDEYIAERRDFYFDLEKEYRTTGTIQFGEIGSESDLSSISGEFWLEMLSRSGKNAA